MSTAGNRKMPDGLSGSRKQNRSSLRIADKSHLSLAERTELLKTRGPNAITIRLATTHEEIQLGNLFLTTEGSLVGNVVDKQD